MTVMKTEIAANGPSFAEAQAAFTKIGLLSFGGPAAQIALMHKVIVDEKKWLSEREYLDALGFCMLLPGPEAMQLATYAGWKLHGLRGGLMAGLLFVIPGALVVLALSMIYVAFGKVPIVEALFLGVKAAVLVIVIEALLRVAKRALSKSEHWIIAALSFVAIFFFDAPFPLIVLIAALFGFLRAVGNSTSASPQSRPPLIESLTAVFWRLWSTLKTIAIWLVIWIAPLLVMGTILGQKHVLTQMAWFFSKLAVVTFGGAYAVLAYMGQDVVQAYGWLTAGEMMDGLGLAETTPGPLILVTEFVGFVAAFKQGGWAMGAGGALVALWATFAPCFLWIFAGAPYIAWLGTQPRLKGALTAIMAAVVGVILNLAVWFALHVIFAKVDLNIVGWLKLWTPTPTSLDWRVVVLGVVSGVLLLWRHWSVPAVLGVASVLAVAMHFAQA
jgi:chromate transporter